METVLQEKPEFSQQLTNHLNELGSLLRGATLECDQEEDESNLYSPIHIAEKDRVEQTEITEDTEIPFLDVERKFSIFKEKRRDEPLEPTFLFAREIEASETYKDTLRTVFKWRGDRDKVFDVRKTISLDK